MDLVTRGSESCVVVASWTAWVHTVRMGNMRLQQKARTVVNKCKACAMLQGRMGWMIQEMRSGSGPWHCGQMQHEQACAEWRQHMTSGRPRAGRRQGRCTEQVQDVRGVRTVSWCTLLAAVWRR